MGTTSSKDKYKKSQCNIREQDKSSGLPPLKCTACLEDLCPRSLDSSLAVWRIVDFSNTTPPASPRFNLSTALESCTIDVFVSHTWYDQVFINGVQLISENRRRARNLPAPDESVAKKDIETTFYDLKCSGLLKGVRQLALRDISSFGGTDTFPTDIKKWRIWMDLVCIDQYDETHKAHVTGLLEVYMREAKCMVVLLSPAYFTRLWCVYEYCCFLAFSDMSRIAVYAWGFCDQLTVTGPERSAAPEAVRALSTSLPDSLRNFSVDSAECSFACDKVLLHDKVLSLYSSVTAFERFARVSGIIIVTWGLVMSPAVYWRGRYDLQIKPWSALARELGFTSLAQVLNDFNAVELYSSHTNGASIPPETVKGYVDDVQKLFLGPVRLIFENEKKLALRK